VKLCEDIPLVLSALQTSNNCHLTQFPILQFPILGHTVEIEVNIFADISYTADKRRGVKVSSESHTSQLHAITEHCMTLVFKSPDFSYK